MNLTQQFVLLAIVPATFIILALYTLVVRLQRSGLLWRWLLLLLTGAVWSSSILSYFGGTTLPQELGFTWRVIGNHALTLMVIWLLLTTLARLNVQSGKTRLLAGLSLLLWAASLGLDPAIWAYSIEPIPADFLGPGSVLRHFDLWGIVWVISWLVPAISSWVLTLNQIRHAPSPLYHNQNNYWFMMVSIFIFSAALGLIRQPVWQQFGALGTIFAVTIGTYTLTRAQLPDIQLATRQVMSRLIGALVIFVLIWLSLWSVAQTPVAQATTLLDLAFPAALLATIFVLAFYLINRLTQRLFLPGLGRQTTAIDLQEEIGNRLLMPTELGELVLGLIQLHMGINDAWLATVEEGPGGKILLRPLSRLKETRVNTAVLEANTLFIDHLRQHPQPLLQYDIDSLPLFDQLSPEERELVKSWQRALFVPLTIGDRLLGLLGLGAKFSGESFDVREFALLQDMADDLSPLLLQAQQIHTLQQLNRYIFQRNHHAQFENQYLEALTGFQEQFMQVISPQLRQPFMPIEQVLQVMRDKLADTPEKNKLAVLEREVNRLKTMSNNLIGAASRVQKQQQFDFKLVQMDEIARQTIAKLSSMSEARRVKLELETIGTLRPVLGDPDRLQEALQHFVHNAVKFNKIGGLVRIECHLDNQYLCVAVIDNGVGIPEDRLANIWQTFHEKEDLLQSHSIKGVSMGLPIAQFIIEAHGGHVEADSKHGAGSTFVMYLPAVLK